MGRFLSIEPAPWAADKYKEQVQKRRAEREAEWKEQHEAKRQKVEAQPTPEEEESEDEEIEENEEQIGGLSLGTSTGAWPHYIRLMFISGYRYVQQLDATTLPCDKQDILDVILKCCPSHKRKVKNTFEDSCNNPFHSLFMSMNKQGSGLSSSSGGLGGFGGFREWDPLGGMFEAHNYFNERETMDGKERAYLDLVGLDPIAELAMIRHYNLPPSVIRRVGEMLKVLKPFVPQKVDDLKETPYDESDEASLDNNGCVELVADFIPVFVKAAEFGDCIGEQS